jgi:hypothetical protein
MGKRDPGRRESHAKQGSQHLSGSQAVFIFVEHLDCAFCECGFAFA